MLTRSQCPAKLTPPPLSARQSTEGILKITKSMKMVSAAKLRGTQKELDAGKAFGMSVDRMLPAPCINEDFAEGLYEAEFPTEKTAIIVMASDKGLCGGVNTQAAKYCKMILDSETVGEASVFMVGDKARGALVRTHGQFIKGSLDECWKPGMNFAKASAIAHRVLSMDEFEQVQIIYNEFKTVVTYIPTMQPVRIFNTIADPAGDFPAPLQGYELEPEVPAEVMTNLAEYTLAVKIYHAALENATSEESSRMSAMENASKNAGEMVEKLTIKYNRARQAKITTELIEIISGAESLKD